MLKRETNNLEMIIQKAREEGCSVIRRIRAGDKDFVFITDAKGILIASDDGHTVVPLEVIPEFIDSLKMSALNAIEYAELFSMAEKEAIAREKGLTYGKYKGKMFQAAEYCDREL